MMRNQLAQVLVAAALLSFPAAGRGDNFDFGAEEAASRVKEMKDLKGRADAPSKINLDLQFDSAVTPETQAQLETDLAFLWSIYGPTASPLHREIFGPLRGERYLSFFKSRISMIMMDSSPDESAIAFYIPAFGGMLWLTQNYVSLRLPQIFRLNVLLHEARHADKTRGHWTHVNCPIPFLDARGHPIVSKFTGNSMAGKLACDDTALGAYGAGLIMMKNIQKFCANCTEKTKMDAGIYADDTLDRILGDAHQTIVDDLYAK